MEYKKYVDELDGLTGSLAKLPQTVGFMHKFYVPGWVGFIQECIVDRKMSKAAQTPICNGMNYLECGDKIVDLVEKACEARANSTNFQGKDNSSVDHLSILNSAFNAVYAWANVYPEIAYCKTYMIDDKHYTNTLGIIQREVENALGKILDVPTEKSNSTKSPSFTNEMKAVGGQFVAMLCNIVVLFILLGVYSGIVSLF